MKNKLIVFFTLLTIVLLALTACTSSPKKKTTDVEDNKTTLKTEPDSLSYKVGDTGPGGGIVFYDDKKGFQEYKNILSGGKRYLEAAPNGWNGGSDPKAVWGAYNESISGLFFDKTVGGTAGEGAEYTELLLAHMGENGTDLPAQLCSNYRGGDFDDWFLPSHGELIILYSQKEKVGGFKGVYYWSSSIGEAAIYALAVNFENGWIGTTEFRDSAYRVRPIRAF